MSKCFNMNSKPVNACPKVIYFFINKSAPFLVNSLCYFYCVIKIKSPAKASGI